MPEETAPSGSTRHYYVDESGDGVIFDAKGRILLTLGRVPTHFIVGLADVRDPEDLNRDLEALRGALMADLYFKDVPSMQAREAKTALYFHAKDDLPEVRREVLKLLLRHEIKFSAVVKRMAAVLEYVTRRNHEDPNYRYRPTELYDHTVKRLLEKRLHEEDRYHIHFARRGNSDRTKVLAESLETARSGFCARHGIKSTSAILVQSVNAFQSGGLQAVDYFLWTLQRFYEKREERYIHLLWPKVSLVHDVDDTRINVEGAYYTNAQMLTAKDLG